MYIMYSLALLNVYIILCCGVFGVAKRMHNIDNVVPWCVWRC